MEHKLKTWPAFYAKIVTGEKPFEIRREDGRTFEVGDLLKLEEFVPCKKCNARGTLRIVGLGPPERCDACAGTCGMYTGLSTLRLVTYKTDFGQPAGQVVLGIAPLIEDLPIRSRLSEIVRHWNEFGPEHGFEELVSQAGQQLIKESD